MTPEQRLALLEDLKTREQRNVGRARVAAWGSVLLAAGITAVLLYFGYRQLGQVNAEIASKKAELEKVKSQLGALKLVTSEIPKADFDAGLARAAQKDPSVEKVLPPRVYIQTAPGADNMQRAREAQRKLREAGFLVPPIEVRQDAPSQTDVRYYKSVDGGDAGKVADVLRGIGEKVGNPQHLARYENSTTARPRHFEVWIGAAKQ
jgi:hypothetical protein